MVKLYLNTCIFVFVFVTGEIFSKNVEDLPSWITSNPGFQNRTEEDFIKIESGSISLMGSVDKGWVIFLNEKAGHGIEVEVQKLSLNPDLDDFLLLSAWPLTGDFKQIKLFTGKFDKPLKKVLIPNTKTLFILYSASPKNTDVPEMIVLFRRYGRSLEVPHPSTENPVKKKETIFEVQLKGKSPDDYLVPEFMDRVKEALRTIAHRYCISHEIPFNGSISTRQMVLIHRVSFCPFEWPERDVCASVEHSIFVSGTRKPGDELIRDYQLTADNLKKMWVEENIPELLELGITVFELPSTYDAIVYWCVIIICLMVISLLIGSVVLWKTNQEYVTSSRLSSTALEKAKKAKRPKMKLAKHQRVPSFMYAPTLNNQTEKYGEPVKSVTNGDMFLKEKFEDVVKPENSSDLPIKNYLGSILFSSNKAFEDDEDGPVELRPKSA